jgi:hypothetical protein
LSLQQVVRAGEADIDCIVIAAPRDVGIELLDGVRRELAPAIFIEDPARRVDRPISELLAVLERKVPLPE